MRSFIPPAGPVPRKRDVALRVGRVLTAEALLRTPLRDGLPGSPGDLTPDQLTSMLCRHMLGARVTSVAATRITSGTTTRGALELTYDEAGAGAGLPRHLFVKCTSSLPQRLMLGMGGLISGEPGFYEHVRPGLEIRAPAGYFGTVDPASWRSLVIIEDVVRTQGASFWEPGRTLAREQIIDLLAGAAGWHGALWESPRLDAWRWLRTPADQARLIDALLRLADRTRAGAKRAAAVIPARLRDRQPDLYAGMRRSMAVLGARPHTYLHGDLHVANTYLSEDGRPGICDWQVGLRGSWAHDVAYLVLTGLEPDDRRACEPDLLDFYLERLGASGAPVPTRAEAWLAYRQATFYPYFAWVYTLGRSRLQPRFQPAQVALMMVERIATAIQDLDSLSAIGL